MNNSPDNSRPRFITFEGPEGAGKSTQCHILAEWLRGLGLDVLVTRQPGGDPVGRKFRSLLLDADSSPITPRSELLLMMADRNQSVRNIIGPHLTAGGTLICDRYADSSVAYQGYGRGIDISLIESLNDFATEGLMPDLTLLLDIDPTVGLSRQSQKTKMEFEPLSFHVAVRNGFLAIAASHPNRIEVIDSSGSIESVAAKIRTAYETHYCSRAGA